MTVHEPKKNQYFRCGFSPRYCQLQCINCKQDHREDIKGSDTVWFFCYYPAVLYNRPVIPIASRDTVAFDEYGNMYQRGD